MLVLYYIRHTIANQHSFNAIKMRGTFMKTLYLIGGTMGVGKTTVCQQVKRQLKNSVFLDGDWCWDASPFQVTDETKIMVVDNICYLLNNFIHCSAYDNIVFCWVMHEQYIIDGIIGKLDTNNCKVKKNFAYCRRDDSSQQIKDRCRARHSHRRCHWKKRWENWYVPRSRYDKNWHKQ